MSFLNQGPQHRAWNLFLGDTGQAGGCGPDGPAWSPVTLLAGDYRAGGVGDGVWALAGGSGVDFVRWSSDNGATWTASTGLTATGDGRIFAIAYGAGRWVAGGPPTSVNVSSDDAQTFTPIVLGWGGGRQGVIKFQNGQFVVFPNVATLYGARSPDGVVWSPVTKDIDEILDLAFGNGRYVGICADRFQVSTDNGVTFTTSNTFAPSNFQRIAFGNDVFVAINRISAQSKVTADGVTVTTQATPATFQSIVFAEGKFWALTNGSDNVYQSADGLTWTVSTNTLPAAAINWGVLVTDGAGSYLAAQAVTIGGTSGAFGSC